jgi:predicted GTPase
MSDNKSELLFFHGPTQTGKSSMIKTLLGGMAEGIQVGTGTGKSTTGPNTRSIRALIGGREFII